MSYLEANKGFYEMISTRFYEVTAQAHTKEEYKTALHSICEMYRRELTNSDIVNYMLSEGMLEVDSVEDIRAFYNSNMGDFQQAFQSANLVKGNKYTLVYNNEFSFPVAYKITFESIDNTTYAQYKDAIKIIFKPYRKHNLYKKYFYDTDLLIYERWRELTQEDMSVKITDNMYQSKYACFDSRYLRDCENILGTPLFKYNR